MMIRGEHGPTRFEVDGWTDGTFGLDRRRYLDDNLSYSFGYCVTHLQTGYAVRYVNAGLEAAKKFAEALHDVSWDFDVPTEAKECGRAEAVKAANATVPTTTGFGFDPPAIAMEARQGGDAQQAPSRSDDSAAPTGIAQ